VTNFGLATNEYFTKNGESQKRTEWHRIVCFGRLAEICRDSLSKGRQVYVEGRIQYRTWEDREGAKRYTTEIVANVVRFLGSKPQNETPQESPELSSDDGPVVTDEE
jgi:single-strand DNA-binding protein